MDWLDPSAKVSKFFTVKECLWLPTWKRCADASDGLDDTVKANLKDLCGKLDKVREFLGKPIMVHVTYRPEKYNALIGGAKNSTHKFGKAMDFHVTGLPCDEVRKLLLPKLADFGLRMEDLPGSGWIHLDTSEPKPNRFFKP